MRKLRIVIAWFLVMVMLSACGSTQTSALHASANSPAATPVATTPPDVTPVPQPVATTLPDDALAGDADIAEAAEATPEQNSVSTTVTVHEGDTLEIDIMPQVAAALDMPVRYVEDAFSEAQSELISGDAQGFRRMEGIIPPGSYDISGKTLTECVAMWVAAAEQRYARVARRVSRANGLSAAERLTLGSIVESETVLADRYERDVAAAFLNRLDAGERLCSCATAEYALGYARPYLTTDDMNIDSAYNTYVAGGLPPGPICVMDDESLAAASAKANDDGTWYFFYDYAKEKIMAFDDYDEYTAAGEKSAVLFDETFDIGRYDKIDKRQYFGG
jgi:cell division protein YceG involved in septum cleavage